MRRVLRALGASILMMAVAVLRARSTLLEVAGFTLLTAAAWRVDPVLGLVVAGGACLVMGFLVGLVEYREKRERRGR